MNNIETMKLALEALDDRSSLMKWQKAREALRQAIEQAEQAQPVANGKLKVTLQDTPTEIELAQYKRMFEAACSELGAINEALGLDPNDGGAEPILFAIEQLRGEPQEPVAWMVYTLDGQSVCVTDNPTDFTPEHRALPLYTSPPPRQPLKVAKETEAFKAWFDAWWLGDGEHGQHLPSQGDDLYNNYMAEYTLAFGAWMAAKQAHGIKGKS